MGKVYSSLIKRPLRNWNVEHRAAEVISLTKPKPAPRHVSDASAPSTSTPNAEQTAHWSSKNTQLDEFLRGAIVRTDKIEFGPPPGEKSSRSLPVNRAKYDTESSDLEYGYMEQAGVKLENKCSLKQAIGFIGQRNDNNIDAKTISKDFQLLEPDVENILKHFHVLLLRVPKTKQQLQAQADKDNEQQQLNS